MFTKQQERELCGFALYIENHEEEQIDGGKNTVYAGNRQQGENKELFLAFVDRDRHPEGGPGDQTGEQDHAEGQSVHSHLVLNAEFGQPGQSLHLLEGGQIAAHMLKEELDADQGGSASGQERHRLNETHPAGWYERKKEGRQGGYPDGQT